jgi:TRAP-type C4-dicarboxylate transport system permease small subunit
VTPAGRLPLRVLEIALGAVLAAALLTSMTVIVIDVAGRYLFSAPLRGADDVNSLAIGLMIFAGLPLVTAREEHIRVDLLTGRMGPRLAGALRRVACVVGAAVLAVMAWKLVATAAIFADFGDTTPMLRLPIAPFAYVMAALAALAAGVQAALALAPAPSAAPESDPAERP